MAVIQHFNEGGIFMYFILGFGFFTVGVVIERTLSLYVKYKGVPKNFRSQILEYIRKGDLAGAENFAKAVPGLGVARIVEMACALRKQAGSEEELQSRMDEALSEEIARVDKRTGFLAMSGNVATLLGLLGTISGMIQSFSAVASANAADRAMLLSKGISEAMNCTAFGLIVAIPALVCYAIFQNKTDKIVTALTETVTKVYHDLVFLVEPGATRNK